MDRRMVLAVYRLGFAGLTLTAILVQAGDLAGRGVLVPANFLSYFTIQSNLIACTVFLIGAARWRSPSSPTWDLVRGQALLVTTVTLVVFALLLSGTDVDTAIQWVDLVVHRIMPIALIIDWLIDPPGPITFGRSLRWLGYPLIWVAYTLIRGAATGWYPYPFLDPANGGYATVGAYIVGVLVFGVVLSAFIAWVGGLARDRRDARLAHRTA
jgi:hypothetical protein